MKVTVNDCLQLESLKKSIVVAGEKNLDNRVRTVSVMDAASADEASKRVGAEGELVLTTFAGMRNDYAMQKEVIRRLADEGTAALVVLRTETSENGGKGYNEVIRSAEENSLPLIISASDEESDYAEIITDVMKQVLYGSNFDNNLINNTIFHLLNFEKQSSFQQALKEAAVNNDFQVVLMSEDYNPVFAVETRHLITIEEAIRRGKEVPLSPGGVYELINVNGVLTYWGTVAIKDEKYYLLIVDNEDNYSSGELTKLAEIIELAMGMWKFTPERDAKADLVKALVRNNRSLAHTLRGEAEIKEENILSVFYAKGINTSLADAAINAFEEKGLLIVHRIDEGDESYGVVLRGPELGRDGAFGEKSACIKLYDDLKEHKPIKIFHVTGLDGIEGAADGFRLINETWYFVDSIFPYKRVFTKYELATVSNCINIKAQGGYLKKNYMDLLEYFRKEEDNKTRQLLETLETFVLDAGMNSGKTADFLGIHTNTVQYRLKKINEVLGVEITGNRVIPGLTVALALNRLEKMPK